MKQKSIQKNAVYNVIKSASSVIFPLITFPYVTRVLQADGIGKVNFAQSLFSYFSLLASLGLPTYAMRECAGVREDKKALNKTAGELFSINMITSLVAYLLLAITLLFAKPLNEYRTLIILQSSTILFTTLGADWINSAMEDFRYITLRTLFFQLLSVGLIILFVKSPDDYLIYVSITVFTAIVPSILNIFYRRKYCRIRFTMNLQFKRHFAAIIWMFVMLLSQNIFNQADVTMLGLIYGDYEVGLYSTAHKIYIIINQVITSVVWVVLPRLSLYYAQQDKEKIHALQRKILGVIIVLGLPCAVGAFVLAEEALLVVGGEAYLAAAPTLRVLMISLLISLFGGGFFGNVIMLPSKRERYFMIACCIAAAFNIVTNALLIPFFGTLAAAGTTALSELILLIVLGCKAKNEVSLGPLRSLFVAPLIGCGVIVLSAEVISLFAPNLWVRTILSVSVGALGYTTILFLAKNEIAYQVLNTIKGRFIKSNEA